MADASRYAADEHEPDDTLKSSDQLPEDGPAHQVIDDVVESLEGAAREAARKLASKHSHNAYEPHHKARELSPEEARHPEATRGGAR